MADETKLTREALDRQFDPEKVVRFNCLGQKGSDMHLVSAADYDALLSAYRALQSENREAKRVNRCPNDSRPLIFDDPHSGHCGLCQFTFSGFPEWNYDPLPLAASRTQEGTEKV